MTSGIPIRAPTTRRSARHHRPDIGHQSGEPTHNSTRLRFDHRSYARAGKLDRFLTVERHFFVWSDFGEAWRRSAQPPPRPAKTLPFLYPILPFFENWSLACRVLSRFGAFWRFCHRLLGARRGSAFADASARQENDQPARTHRRDKGGGERRKDPSVVSARRPYRSLYPDGRLGEAAPPTVFFGIESSGPGWRRMDPMYPHPAGMRSEDGPT